MRPLLLLVLLTASASAGQSRLAGTWLKDGQPYAELKANGTGRVNGGGVLWKEDGRVLTMVAATGESEAMPYTLKGKTLTVRSQGGVVVLVRAGGKGAKAGKAQAGGDQLSKLILSSAWCSFSYNQRTGSSHQERVVFRGDGTWGKGARGESYSSGQYGSVAGQSDSSAGGRWEVRSGRLLLSSGGGGLEDAGLEVSRNSNGYPILKSAGKEYSSCN